MGYPVDWELRKKWGLFQELGLGSMDLAEFPGWFSYSLHDRLMPRLEFCGQQGVSIEDVVLLRVGMAGGDTAFAKEFVGVEPEIYDDFVLEYKMKTKQERMARTRTKRRASNGGGGGEDERGNAREGEEEEEFLCSETVCD